MYEAGKILAVGGALSFSEVCCHSCLCTYSACAFSQMWRLATGAAELPGDSKAVSRHKRFVIFGVYQAAALEVGVNTMQ